MSSGTMGAMVDAWSVLLDVLILLSAATVLGIGCACIRQSPLLGYLAAGTLLGPNALQIVSSNDEVALLAELGIALLLFAIGLEFSWKRLLGLGRTAMGGGVFQVLVTMAITTGVSHLAGASWRVSVALGAIVALSSTACVLRLLVSRAEIESHHGRHALGVLLVQDAAVVPLVLVVALLGGSGGMDDVPWAIARALGGAIILILALLVILRFLVPPLLALDTMRQSRELPVLLAIVVGLGAAWASHQLGLSPALGAFVAGMLLAASPFATQVRADVSALQTVLVTLFFGSIGMMGDPVWLMHNLALVLAVVASVIAGKAVIVWLVLRVLGVAHESALMTGLCLAQIGEFSFVLATTARGDLIDEDLLRLIVSATIISLFVTPYLVSTAPWVAPRVIAAFRRARLISAPARHAETPGSGPAGHVVLIGFGPAGRMVGARMAEEREDVVVLDLSPKAVAAANHMGLTGQIGDAAHADVLAHAGVTRAGAVVVTVPDPSVANQIVHVVRAAAPDVHVIVRARYHLFVDEIRAGGASELVDEETLTGRRLAARLRRYLARHRSRSVADTPPAAR